MYRQIIVLTATVILIAATTTLVTVDNNQLTPSKSNKEYYSAYPKNLSYRLPNTSLPLHYNINITWIDEVSYHFSGRSIIQLVITEPTDVIVVHSKLAIIGSVLLISEQNDGKILPTTWTYSNVTDFLSVKYNGTLLPGSLYRLAITYSSTLETGSRGFFRRSYLNFIYQNRYMAITNFQPSHARHAFPCYDEPHFKATFTISLTYNAIYHAISNMRVISKSKSSRLATATFATTPPISSYSIAFAITDLVRDEVQSNSTDSYSKTLVGVLTRPCKKNEGKLALYSGVSIVSEIGRHLGIPFSLDKIDQIVVPQFIGWNNGDWGLVLHGEDEVLWGGIGAYSTKDHVILMIIARKISHQWFGDLVTPDWWEYIWLNEGFANYYGYKGVDLSHPEMKIMDYYVVENVQNLFFTDASVGIRPMSLYVEDPYSVETSVSDSIVTRKAGSVIRMFSHAFNENTFTKGLNKYLNAKSFKTATEDDLFANIAAAVKEDNRLDENLNVPDIMRSWTRQSGFPLLNVTRDYNRGNIILSQTRYFNFAKLHGTSNSTWWIPYNFITGNKTYGNSQETIAERWFNTSVSVISQTNSSQWTSNNWIYFNKNATGYYRIMYDEQNYDLLATALKNGKAEQIDSLGRSQLLDDTFNFLQTYRWNNYGVILNLMQFLKDDVSFAPWWIGSRVLQYLKPKLAGTEQHNRFQKFLRNLVEKLYKSVGIDDPETEKTYLSKYARNTAIQFACSTGLKICQSETSALLKDVLDNKYEFHQEIRRTMYCESFRGAKKSEYNKAWRMLADFNNNDNNYRNLLFLGLSCVDDKKLLNEYLNSALNCTNDKLIVYKSAYEQQQVITNVYSNSLNGYKMAIKYLIQNLDEAYRTYATCGLSTILGGIANRVTNQFDLSQYEKLAKLCKEKNYVSQGNLDQYNRAIEQNFQWNDQYLHGINDWLKHNV